MDRQTDGWMDGRMDGWKGIGDWAGTDGWTNGRMDGRSDGQTDRRYGMGTVVWVWADRWTERQTDGSHRRR